MSGPIRLAVFLSVALAVEGVLLLALLPFFPLDDALGLTAVMLPFALWASRLIVAHRRGRITRRFLFMNTLGIPTSLIVWNPDTLDRATARWEYTSYLVRETVMCAFAWIFMLANMVLPHLLA